jgi:signal transduction histidine kinase
LCFHAVSPGYRDLLGRVLRFDEPALSVTAFKERRLVQHTDPGKAPMLSHEMAKRFGNRIVLAAPLIARDQCLGVAVLLWDRRAQTFSQPEGRALAVAGQLALALLSAQLYQDVRRSYAELERTQKELIDRERLAALGGLSASIAHEVRNPLGVIFNSVGSLRRLLRPSGDVALLLDIVGEEADRLNRMVGDLLDYSRPVRPAVQPLPLRPLLDEALTSARQQIGTPAEGVKVDIRLASEAATVRGDARLLRQALINVFLNAYQAMPRGGQLDVRAARRLQDGVAIAEIAIRDSGAGIPAEARDKIFQPFFTTKAMGTGLGLAVVKRIVEGHGGTIALREAAVGAEFQLRLPIEG